jgi:hypothetical protein
MPRRFHPASPHLPQRHEDRHARLRPYFPRRMCLPGQVLGDQDIARPEPARRRGCLVNLKRSGPGNLAIRGMTEVDPAVAPPSETPEINPDRIEFGTLERIGPNLSVRRFPSGASPGRSANTTRMVATESNNFVGSGTGAVLVRARFQPPPRRTARTDFQYAALRSASHQGLCDLSCWARCPAQVPYCTR